MSTGSVSVLDASAVLALLRGEPGADAVERVLDGSNLSTVNLSEVLQKAEQHAVATDGLENDLEALGVRLCAFDEVQARLAADVWTSAPNAGLALGDRACLALARFLDGEAVTADRGWAKLSVGVKVRVLR